ncbi:MAG: hypothetical protein J6I65_00165 [Lachnospiraceae bacterium]|nr:hypothetical protein [Lachnospiraceae bacterium]
MKENCQITCGEYHVKGQVEISGKRCTGTRIEAKELVQVPFQIMRN